MLILVLLFDGDSDRCLAVDEKGNLIDGDKLIAIFAKELKRLGQLNGNTAVVTVMTNIGFKKFARENDIDIAETGVGDRYVLENMLKNDYSIGGEQSGHIIFKNMQLPVTVSFPVCSSPPLWRAPAKRRQPLHRS